MQLLVQFVTLNRNNVSKRTSRHALRIHPRISLRIANSRELSVNVTKRYAFVDSRQSHRYSMVSPVERLFQTRRTELPTQPSGDTVVARESSSETDIQREQAPFARATDDEHTLQQITDRVIQSIDNRIIAQRERLGVD